MDALAAVSGKPLLNLRPETKSKLKKRREELETDFKAESEKEAKEAAKEAQDAKEAAKRRAEQERIANLPAAEQAKVCVSTIVYGGSSTRLLCWPDPGTRT